MSDEVTVIDEDEAELEAEEADGRRHGLAAVLPQGPLQVVVGVVALCFLAGAVGYLVGTRQSAVPTSAIDEGFLVDMSAHHDQAVQMALCTVSKAEDGVVQKMAAEVLVFQNRELARMGSLMEQARIERPADEGRTAMGWMGMATPVEKMPGMASPADYDALCAATGRDVDRRFLALMRAHHIGGVHMAETAAQQAASPAVRQLASVMARNQKIEANEYENSQLRLGFL